MTDKFNPVELAKTSKTFCIFPWIQQYVGPPGDVKPCCVYNNSDEIGSLKENTLKEIWNNDKTKQMRLNFLNGIEEPSCDICNRRTELGHAHRNEYNRMFFEQDEEIQQVVANTNADGSLDEHKLYYIDVRYNNLCNLSCRSCAPHYSTSWVLDHRKLYNLQERRDKDDGFQFPGKTDSQAIEEILPHLATAKMVYFAGGEPLMQKEHYMVLDKLIELGNTDLEIRYNTNFSVLKLKGYDSVLDYWKKFSNVHVYASLDGNHKKAEYWRNGTVWETVVDNRKKMIEECPHVNFMIAYTLSWPNSFNLVEFHKEWVELGLLKIDHVLVNPLDTPFYYCLKNLPDWKKRQIEEKLQEAIDWLKTVNPTFSVISMYETAIKFMWDTSGQYYDGGDQSLREFDKITTRLDDIRGQSFFDVYPEHMNIKNYIIQNGLGS
jgi:radical SAM protein with 4Fe4S-binding SPASM domain